MRTRERRYWRNIALVTGLALLAGSLLILAFIVFKTADFATDTLHPPHTALDQNPPDVGIEVYADVTFVTGDGITLRGWYVPSQNGAAIVMAHGYGGNRVHLLPEAGILARQGYGVLLFDFRGHGESEDALVTIGDHERRDLVAAVDFVSAQPEVDPDRIGAIGFSMGAATLAQVAAEDERLRAVVIEAAFPALEEVIRYRARLLGPLTQIPSVWAVQRAGVDVDDVTPIDDLCAISPRPVFLIYGDRDRDIPPGTAQDMFDAACEPIERWLITGAGHGDYLDVEPDAYPRRLLAFFDTWLHDRD